MFVLLSHGMFGAIQKNEKLCRHDNKILIFLVDLSNFFEILECPSFKREVRAKAGIEPEFL